MLFEHVHRGAVCPAPARIWAGGVNSLHERLSLGDNA